MGPINPMGYVCVWAPQVECSFGMRSLSGTQIFSASVTSDTD